MKKTSLALIICMAAACGDRVCAQDNLPFVINAAGGYSSVAGQLYDFSFGEMVLVNTFTAGPNLLSQGFLQPFLVPTRNTSDVVVDNNVITPNGDGKNDVWTVDNLDRYPDNKVSIFDRAGRLVYQATNYKNDWNGTVNGKPLNEDAYYYIIDIGKGYALIRGSITIVRDR